MQTHSQTESERSCFHCIVVGRHSVGIWRTVCCCRSTVTMVGVRRVLRVSVREIWSQGRSMGCSLEFIAL